MKTFKISLLCLLMCIMSAMSFAQTPEKLSYQAVFRNMYDRLVTNQTVNVQISILQGSAEGTVVFEEIQTVTTNAEGIASFEIGAGTPSVGTMAEIDWAKGPYFMKVETNPEGGEEMTVVGNIELLSVPFAMYVNKAGNTFSGDYKDLKNAPEIPVLPTKISELENNSGYRTTETQKLILNGNTLTLSDASNVIELPAYSTFDGSYANVVNKPTGKNTGDLLYWDAQSASWLTVAPGKAYQVLCMGEDMVPFWKDRPGFDQKPTVTTGAAANVLAVTATLNGEVFSAAPIKSQGFFYGIEKPDTKVVVANGEKLTFNLDGLNDGTEYQYFAFAENANGITEGETKTFTTNAFKVPTVNLNTWDNVTKTGVRIFGYVIDTGYLKINAAGVYLGTERDPFNTGKRYEGTIEGMNFTVEINDLNPETLYHYVVFAENDKGIGYNTTDWTFTTLPVIVEPKVEMGEIRAIKQALALNGKVTDKGKATKMDEVGFYYGLEKDPVTTGKQIVSTTATTGNAPVAFTATTEDLEYGKIYHVVAYAKNEAGTTYSDEVEFEHKVTEQFKKCGDMLYDIESQGYKTVQIGTQCWMQENLKTTVNPKTGQKLTSGFQDIADVGYGLGRNVYYNWTTGTQLKSAQKSYSVADPTTIQGMCPDGWHIPTYEDFHQLCNEVDLEMNLSSSNTPVPTGTSGQQKNSNNQLCVKLCQPHENWTVKSGTTYSSQSPAWYANNPTETGPFNESGFSALPYGYANNCGTTIYVGVGNQCGLLTANAVSSTSNGRTMGIKPALNGIIHENANNHGWSIRCVCDQEFERPFKTCGDNLQDVEGNSYKTTQIGKQCWMADNLRVKSYQKEDGSKGDDLEVWSTTNRNSYYASKRFYAEVTRDIIGTQVFYPWCTAVNMSTGNTDQAKKIQGICPAGWHVPSWVEFATMFEIIDPKWNRGTSSHWNTNGNQGNTTTSNNQLAIKLASREGHWAAYAHDKNGYGAETATCHSELNSPGYAYVNDPDNKEKWFWNESTFSAFPAGYIDKGLSDGTDAASNWTFNGTLNLWTSISNGTTTSNRPNCVKIACYNTGAILYTYTNEIKSCYSVRCICDELFEEK